MKRFTYLLLALLLIFPVFAVPQGKAGSLAVIDPLVSKALDTASSLQVIVTFKGDSAPTNSQLSLLKTLGIETGISMKSLPIAGVIATKAQIEKLAANPEVQSIYMNRKLSYFNADATAITGVDKARTDDSFRKANDGLPVSGKGIGVVVNDSGVDGTHKDHELGKNLVQNVMGSTNLNALAPGLLPVTYQENVPNTDTNSGHGTHVAGTVGGTGAMSGGKYEGAAPGADLIGYGSGAALFVLDGIGGFDYAITHQSQYNIRVITNSWGSSGDFDPNDPINIASKKAHDRGITVLFAAGNEGPGENTHNPYAKAPWVISLAAAGVKDGKLADFSSRGTKGVGGTFTMDGKEWTWKDEPTVTAPGVDIVSTRVIGPVASLAIDQDAETIEPAYLPYYTTMSGTSMATPHVAGIVALMLEANPLLSPAEIKSILEQTATNMPGYETWEVGAGYVNAYAAIDKAFNDTSYGETLNATQTFYSNVNSSTERKEFSVDYNPLTFISKNQYEFTVEEGMSSLMAKVNGAGLMEQTGNPINLVLIAPDGTEYSSGVSLLFPLYYDRTVSVTSPAPGAWKAEIRGLRGADTNPLGLALPETVKGEMAFTKVSGFSGLNDIAGHPAADAIKMGVSERLFDGFSNGAFKPDALLTRAELAKYLVMGAEIKQVIPAAPSFSDVSKSDLPFVEAAAAKGASFRDHQHIQKGVILPKANSKFSPKDGVTRAELAYSLVQSLGLQKEAEEFDGQLTVQYNDERIAISDVSEVPDHLKGYVQVALDLNILNAKFAVTQGPYDLKPKVTASFNPSVKNTRGDFAVAMTRYYNAFLK
ncbi:S8 family serine peptidase [Mesobacillus subterraneus]|uniref:S8 family serine peptidase n=1 Tax=Mesobacillus subterraneus TaxID=285983 RepID=UPI00273D5A5F|nr:S8 family serine peptidase [Mesobacillus subterraneus]WLR55605.1 S8 family serine peptidase [Mesobacillus subterraneus]